MDKKLYLIDTEDEFCLKIDGKEIPYIIEYSITVKADSHLTELDLKLSIPAGKEIVVESKEVKLL